MHADRQPFGEALAILRRWSGVGSLLSDVVHFYRLQLLQHPEALAYLAQRGVHKQELVEGMCIGYAPGGCLRAYLMRIGSPRDNRFLEDIRWVICSKPAWSGAFETDAHRLRSERRTCSPTPTSSAGGLSVIPPRN